MYAMYKEVEIAETKEMVGTGWLPPLPDLRDYTEEEPDIARIAKKLGISPTKKTTPSLPAKVDLGQLVGLRNQTIHDNASKYSPCDTVMHDRKAARIFVHCM